MNSAAIDVLARIGHVSAPERARIVARLAHAHAGSRELHQLIDDLSTRGRYEVRLALTMAVVTRDEDYLHAMLDSPDQDVLARTLVAWVRIGGASGEVVERLPGLSHRARTSVYRALRRHSGTELATALLAPVREQFGDREAAQVLPSCSPGVVAKELPTLAHAVGNWTTIARRHPAAFLTHAEAAAVSATSDDWRELWRRIVPGLRSVAVLFPERVLDLARQAVPHVDIGGLGSVAHLLAEKDSFADIVAHPSSNGSTLAKRIAPKTAADRTPTSALPALLQTMRTTIESDAATDEDKQAAAARTVDWFVWGARDERSEYTSGALRGLKVLADNDLELDWRDLGARVPAGSERRVFDALGSHFRDAARNGSFSAALDFATGLGKRAWGVGTLQRLVYSAASAEDDDIARRATALSMANPVTRDTIGEALLKNDPSRIRIPAVAEWVSDRRTDLLDRVLTGSNVGRFVTAEESFVPSFRSERRWTADQQHTYAGLLAAHDDSAADAVHRTDDPQEKLSRLHRLVEEKPDSVTYADIVHGTDWVTPQRMYSALRPILASESSAAVAAGVRIAGERHVPQAIEVAEWAFGDAHSAQVRRAAVLAAAELHTDDKAWEVLASAATDPVTAETIIATRPESVPPQHRSRYADLIAASSAAPQTGAALPGLLALAGWTRWATPKVLDVLVDRVCRLDRQDLWRAAEAALLEGVKHSAARAPLLVAVDRLLALDDVAAHDRDLPARQRLTTLCTSVAEAAARGDLDCAVVFAIADRLAKKPLWRRRAIELHLRGSDWSDLDATRIGSTRSAAIADDTGSVGLPARIVAERLRDRMSTVALDSTRAQEVHALAAALCDSSGTAAGLIAVEVVEFFGPRFDWSQDWKTLLHKARAHSDLDVAQAAVDIFTIDE